MKKCRRIYLTRRRPRFITVLRLGMLILLFQSSAAMSTELRAEGYTTQSYHSVFPYQAATTQTYKSIKVSLLSSDVQTDSDLSQPHLDNKVEAKNIIFLDPYDEKLRVEFNALDEQLSITGNLNKSNEMTLSMDIANKTNETLHVIPGIVITYKNYFGFHYTTSVPAQSIDLPPDKVCQVGVAPSVNVTLKTKAVSSVSERLAYGMTGGLLKLSPDHYQGNQGVLIGSDGQVGPTYSFPNAALDELNKAWEWTPSSGSDLDIVFPSISKKRVAGGQYRGTLTVTLSCE